MSNTRAAAPSRRRHPAADSPTSKVDNTRQRTSRAEHVGRKWHTATRQPRESESTVDRELFRAVKASSRSSHPYQDGLYQPWTRPDTHATIQPTGESICAPRHRSIGIMHKRGRNVDYFNQKRISRSKSVTRSQRMGRGILSHLHNIKHMQNWVLKSHRTTA
jgi:hypothetical protein